MKDRIKQLSKEYIDDIITVRRKIHANPELSFEEKETSALIQAELDNMGIEYRTGFAKYGILGIIKGEKGNGKTVALRADMDALPLEENNKLSFKSLNKGKMHAC
jgi:hippurate hydrolase